MFYYYGAKHRLAHEYPAPLHELIIEPFAGAAGYSMYWLCRRRSARALLIEKDERVAEAWERLLSMSPAQIAALEPPSVGEWTSDFIYMTACASNATATCSRMRVTKRSRPELLRMVKRMALVREAVGDRVRIQRGSWESAPDIEATWFVDPPYKQSRKVGNTPRAGGMGYAKGCNSSSVDFRALGQWCRERRGQVIACDYSTSTWLPFSQLVSTQDSSGKRYSEGIWTNIEPPQLGLFG